MSSLFQGFTKPSGTVNTTVSATVPAGSVAYRGILIAPVGGVPSVVIKTDTGQARTFVGGLAVEASTGILLVGGPTTPFLSAPGGVQTDQNGSVQVKAGDPEVIHQGVGLQNNGTLTCSNIPS